MRLYEPPFAAKFLTDQPRFGHSQDFMSILGGKEEREDYITGLIFAGAVAGAFLLLWMVVLLVLKCMGSRRVGFLSGHAFVKPAPSFAPQEGNNNGNSTRVQEVWIDEKHQHRFWRPTVIRIIFLLSGTMFIISSCLLLIKGINNLEATTVTLNKNAEDIHNIAAAVERIHEENFVEGSDLVRTAGKTRQALLDEFSDTSQLCPRDPSLVSTRIAREISSGAGQASGLLEGLEDFLAEDTDQVLALSQQVQAASKQVQDVTAIEIKGWETVVGFLVCILVPALLMLGAGLGLTDISIPYYSAITNWFLLPLFILLVVACSVLQGVTGVALGVNSDACLPAGQPFPDDTVFAIVERFGFTPNSDVYEVVDWYVSQCDADGSGRENPLQPLEKFQPILETGKKTVDQLSGIFDNKVLARELSNECGRDFSELQPKVQNLLTLLHNLNETLQQILTLFRCEDIVAIYTAIVYDGACTYSIQAIFWTYCSALAMAFFGMLMITFRASCRNTEDPYTTAAAVDTDGNDSTSLCSDMIHATAPIEGTESRDNFAESGREVVLTSEAENNW